MNPSNTGTASSEIANTVAQIKSARDLVRQALAGCGLPQIQSIVRHADQNLHWALWNLAEPGTLFPEAGED